MKNPITQVKRYLANRKHPRDPQWESYRRAQLVRQPECQWCGSRTDLQVHHVLPFHTHPDRELDFTNFITLCEKAGVGCHLGKGHLGNFRQANVYIRECCEYHRNKERQTDGKATAGNPPEQGQERAADAVAAESGTGGGD